MCIYETTVVWKEGKTGEVHAGGKPSIEVTSSPEHGEPENIWTPEDLLTSAVAGCILTSTLFFSEQEKIRMRSYMSNATGSMEETSNGWVFSQVNVEVSITLEDPEQAAAMRAVVEQAAKICPISNSLNGPVHVDLHLK